MIHAIIDWALRNRLLVILLTVLITVGGVISYQQLPKDIYPDLNAPLVNIITTCPGMAAEDVERMITFPLESLMHGTPHVVRVRSESTTGESVVTVEFDWGIDIYLARQIVAGKLDIVANQLPAGASQPVMGPVSSRMGEIFEFAVTGNGVDPLDLRGVTDWTIRYRLLGIEGVSFIVNLGGFTRQYQVFLKPDMLHHYGVTIGEVKEAIEKSNCNFSGGVITKKNQEFLIKGIGRIESMEHIESTVITSRNNVPVFVKDVADVKEGARFPRENAGLNGADAVSVVVQKQYGGDTLSTISNVKKFLSEIVRDLPEKFKIVPYYDQSKLIISSLRHLGIAMLEGGLLVLLVIMLFLANFRASMVAALTIPVSVLLSLIFMHAAGVSLTVMALGGLAVGVGKMASGSVILVENIVRAFHADTKGTSSLEVSSLASKEIGPYLFSANLIIILVFLPLLGLEGIAGRMFRPTAFALIVALFGALIINITLQPVLMSFCPGKREGSVDKPNRVVEFATRIYSLLLNKAFLNKKLMAIVSVSILAVGILSYPRLGSEFVPFLDEGSMIASTVMLPETSIQESVRIGKKIEMIFSSFPEVVHVCRTTGSAEESEHVHPVNHSHYIIDLKPRESRDRGYQELTEAMRRELEKIPGIVYIFEQPIANKMSEMLTGAEGQIALKLFGSDLEILNAKVHEIEDVMSGIPGVADLQIEETTGIPQIIIRLKRELLARYGIKVGDVAEMIETALNGVEVADVWEGNRITSVLVRFPEQYRQDSTTIQNMLVETPSGQRIPLSQLAIVDKGEGPQTIFRENLTRRKILICNVIGRDVVGFVEEAKEKIASSVQLPQGYYFTFGGQFESQQRTNRQLMWMMFVVALAVMVVLFASLHSFRQSVLLLLNVPMTVAGGVIALLVTGQTLNVSSLIGFIALFGIALQNGIVLVGTINDLRRNGVAIHDAVIQGAIDRFRPIFMTELILILGVLPLALGSGAGSEIHRPLAIVYIGGFLVAIFFVQIVFPILYEWMASWGPERFLAVKAKNH
ncbi:MAG: hypothetical protein A2283_19330 [Lentisphaerae bacterium RIFOXYA12_FULL_48_11]|nr:MAG: hypothetical protein A2283_19330 [Lentisphaerae bacterium RIFOXYA12_FULL_48_11]